MAQAETRVPTAPADEEQLKRPAVLVILVVTDAEAWLPQCLVGLSRQTYPRLGVLAVDNGSVDGSSALLRSALGADRVLSFDEPAGFAAAVALGLRSPLAGQA